MNAQETQGALSIEHLCQLGSVSRAGFYRFGEVREPKRTEADLRDKIQTIALDNRFYGYRRVCRDLWRIHGLKVNHKHVPRLMREDNLLCLPPDVRHAARQERSKPLVAALEAYMREQYERLSPKNEVAKAIRYMLVRWASFTRFLDDGRICLSNNAAERALHGAALGRRNWTFAGSDEGGRRAAAVYSLIETALCRARHKAVYAALRTMPNGSGRSRDSSAFARRRADFVAVPFGIVLSPTARRGRRADGRWDESGLACRAGTA